MTTDQNQPTLSSGDPKRSIPLLSLASVAVVALLACLLAIDALTHAKPLVLPAISVGLSVVGFAWATGIALRHRHSGVALQDRMVGPGLVVFFGFAAAMLSDSDQLVKYLYGQ